MTGRTFDYEGESAAPRPVSATVSEYLRKSISVSEIMARLLRGWLFALLGALLGVLAGIYVIWVTPPSYTVTITLLPLEAGSGDLSGGGGIGMDILSGLMGSNGPVPKFTRFVASLYSTGLATAMDKKFDSVCVQFACNRTTREWPRAHGVMGFLDATIAAIAHLPDPSRPHTPVDLAQWVQGNVLITSDRNTKMLALSMDTREPKKASAFLLQLVDAANDYIKDQDNAIVKKQLEYVTAQLKTNSDLSQRDALTKMLADEEQHLMLTAVDLPYVAQIEDGPTVETANRSIKYLVAFVMFGFLLGGALGIALSFVPENKRFWRSPWKNY